MNIPDSPAWLGAGGRPPTALRCVLYLDGDDIDANLPPVREWFHIVRSALLPLVQPAGAPAPETSVNAVAMHGDGQQGRLQPRDWDEAVTPGLLEAWAYWGYGDAAPHGPLAAVDLYAFRVQRDSADVRLEVRARLSRPDVLPMVVEALVDVMRRAGDGTDVAYGEMVCGWECQAPYTGLDLALRRHYVSHAQSRTRLRGYEWVTLCPPPHATALGGADGLRATGAFADVVELAAGGLLLRATRSPSDYTPERAGLVFEAVRAALPAGRPRPMEGADLRRVVMEDAHG